MVVAESYLLVEALGQCPWSSFENVGKVALGDSIEVLWFDLHREIVVDAKVSDLAQ